MAYLGPGCSDREARILNRIITYTPAGCGGRTLPMLTWEADSRHVQLAARHFGLQTASTRLTVGDKVRFNKCHPLMGEELEGGEVLLVRSGCMRIAFLAMDRPEIQYMGKECARVMNKPSIYGLECVKHIVRFLLSAPRLVWHYPEQRMCGIIDYYSDTNWAGCPVGDPKEHELLSRDARQALHRRQYLDTVSDRIKQCRS